MRPYVGKSGTFEHDLLLDQPVTLIPEASLGLFPGPLAFFWEISLIFQKVQDSGGISQESSLHPALDSPLFCL